MSEYRKEKQISREREMDSMRGWGERKRDRKGKRGGGGESAHRDQERTKIRQKWAFGESK